MWPLSRVHTPKQFIPIQGKTLFQLTLERLHGLAMPQMLVMSAAEQRFFVADELAKQPPALKADVLLEPAVRDTAPAIALAALHILKQHGNQAMVVMPSDHIIRKPEVFQEHIKNILAHLEQDAIVTLGIVANAAKTDYGYLEQGQAQQHGLFEVRAFHEKPDAETAAQCLKQGGYYWNSGIFIFYAQHYIDLLERFASDMLTKCRQTYEQVEGNDGYWGFPAEPFNNIEKISCDYAVMEKAEKIQMMPVDIGWDDVGSWVSFGGLLEKDAAGNQVYGDVTTHEAQDNIVYAQQRLVSLSGVKNCVVVETKDAVLVSERSAANNLKSLVQDLSKQKRSELEWAPKVFRPWGSYEQIDQGENFQVKRLIVKPGQVLSLQLHHKRSEHWVVVKGVARVTKGEDVFDLKENESVYIPVGTKHRLENCTQEDLFLIEVQCGSYLGEDDIVRFEDVYGRVK